MKKIVEGLRYDTEKAITVGGYDNIHKGATSTRDFGYWEATLYKTTRAGNYFLHGYGGPQSRFAQAEGRNSWSGGADIIPLTKEDAFDWAQRYLEPEAVEAEFGEMITDA